VSTLIAAAFAGGGREIRSRAKEIALDTSVSETRDEPLGS
jgi:hypothetical protein